MAKVEGSNPFIRSLYVEASRGAPVSTSAADFNAKVIDEFRANAGRVGDMFENMPLLLLHHTGAKTGQARVNPLAYLADDGRYVIFASKGGAPEHPAWYRNLKAQPDVQIEVGTDTIDVHAVEADGEQRDRLFRAQAERLPQFGEYEQKTDRVIPVIVLKPVAAG
jgi:deazaflavin-dependent oxidoreductase (nitroreductase family)